VSLFAACIGCRGCREACPICSCVLCDYETARTLHSPELVRAEAKRKGSVRVPAGTLQFQLGRLMHISPSCTACGQCSDVCPVDIPVADIFIRAANLVQESLDYAPGRDTDDTPPMATYLEKELLDITD
ncbi:coenzyme F420 hydrogenase, partial [Candidatus Fermentibacteria bacterium]